ncbi:urease subunit beta [Streptomyces sp. NPDC093586]|uniref:urease subunit beta n=1 Tax=Streptomyces sp. NPDC093586 TaxID=3366042 RepID=UPI00381E924F
MNVPGEWLLSDEPVEINTGRRTVRMKVRNTGDRPVQVGSHFHFFEVNRALEFDRTQALGMRLNVPAGQAIRFEPGDERDVELVEFGGTRRVTGFNGLVDGAVTARRTVERARVRAAEHGFTGEGGPGTKRSGTVSDEVAEDGR